MKKRFVWVIALFLLSACRTVPLLNVEGASVVATVENATALEVSMAIQRAGDSLGWIMRNVGDGHIVGTFLKRDHKAVVDIAYNTRSYSITYSDSANLDYDGSNIHTSYNRWVVSLNMAIQEQLNQLKAGK